MNFANYSPYNKSYRFICFQNQAYHQKNKSRVAPCIKSNIRYSLNKSSDNPQAYSERRSYSSHRLSRSNDSDLVQSQALSSMAKSSSLSNAFIKDNKRVVHKHFSYQKFRQKKINFQNTEMVNRLLQAQCHVVKKDHTQKSFTSHLRYRQIRKKYSESGTRKSKMCLGNSSLLCPTLHQYNKSGLAQKFVELDLSMSMAPSPTHSRLRKRRSDFQIEQEIQNQA